MVKEENIGLPLTEFPGTGRTFVFLYKSFATILETRMVSNLFWETSVQSVYPTDSGQSVLDRKSLHDDSFNNIVFKF